MQATIAQPETKQQSQTWRYYGLTLLLLSFLGIIGYGSILKAFFVADDFYLLRLAKTSASPFSQNIFIFYRPWAMLTWQWSFGLFGFHSSFYHFFNLAIHVLNSLLIAFIINLVAGNRKYDWVAAALFCAYPLHPEAVTWSAGRFDLLSTTGQLAAFYCLVRCYQVFFYSKNSESENSKAKFFANKKGWFWLAATLFSYLAALLCKEAALFLPLVCLIYLLGDFWFRKIQPRLPLMLFMAITTVLLAAVSGFYLIVRLISLGSYSKYDLADYNLPNYFFGSLGDAFTLLIAPVNRVLLAAHTKYLFIFIALSALIFGIALLIFVLKIWQSKQTELKLLLLLSFGWVLTSILPAMLLPYLRTGWKIGDLDGSRAFYSASFGICLIIAVGLVEISNFLAKKVTAKPKVILPIAAVLVCLIYTAILISNNEAWVMAGKESNQIVQSFSTVIATVQKSETSSGKNAATDAIILMRGIPAKYKGAYVALNMFIFEDNPGEDFYNSNIPVMWQYAGDSPPDLTSSKGKTIFVAQYNVDAQGSVQLIAITKQTVAINIISIPNKVEL